ncbi:MAG: translocation/assembly module TamB domain-containing protein, partial [Cyanobacteria bacterium J06641_5]
FTASPSTGRYVLNEGRLQVGESDYRLRAEATLDPENWQNLENMRYQASLEAPQVRLRDVFSMLQLQTVADLGRGFGSATYGDASDLDIVPIELAAASLADRIEHLGKIDRELAVARSQETTATIPPLSEFNGDFALAAEIAGQGLDPATAKGQVTLEGQTWQWGETLAAQEAKISLEIADGSVTLLPLRLAYGKSSIELTGSTDLDFSNLVASLAVREVPIEIARNFITFPPEIGFGGRLEADVTVSGSPATPNATGEFVVADATLNENPIARVEGGFTYNQSQLLFSAEGSILADSEPVTLVGTVPLQLPNSPVTPPSDLLEIRAVVKDEALAFLDVLTNNQVKWGGGKAAIELDITGSFDGQNFRDFRSEDLVAEGQVTFTDAQIDIATLAEPLTTINGAATFDLQTLSTEGIRAQLGGGEVTITGALPFFVTSDDRLTVTASDVKVNALNGLFKSQVEGTLLVGGTALATRIGGNLRAFKGTLDLANLPEVPATPAVAPVLTASSTPVVASAPTLANLEEERDPKSGLAKSLQLDSELPVNSCKFAPDTPFLLQNLQIEAGPLFRVSVPFIADFFTEGNFRVDGPLLDVPKACPEGTVTLTRGTVSIGSTRFRLDNEQEQTATFVPQQGLDPTLDVSLRAQVLEATRQPETSDPSQTEITDEPNTGGNFGAAESIRISAQVQGRATQLLANEEDLEEILILSSNPRRSDGEILSLLGQGVLGGGSALGLASSLTGGLQAAVADALGLSQFSIFPLAVADSGDSAEGDGGASTSIELAAETGIDLTNKVTFSVLAILTQQQPLLYSLRYRVNEKISVRGLTDLSANDSLTVNFETRF